MGATGEKLVFLHADGYIVAISKNIGANAALSRLGKLRVCPKQGVCYNLDAGEDISEKEGGVGRRRLTPQRNRVLIQRSIVGAILLTALMVLGGVLFGAEGTFDRMSCMLPIAFVLNFGLVYSVQFGIEMNRLD